MLFLHRLSRQLQDGLPWQERDDPAQREIQRGFIDLDQVAALGCVQLGERLSDAARGTGNQSRISHNGRLC